MMKCMREIAGYCEDSFLTGGGGHEPGWRVLVGRCARNLSPEAWYDSIRMLRGRRSAHLSKRSTVPSVVLRAASSWRRALFIDDTGGDVPAGLTGFPSPCFSGSATAAGAEGSGESPGSGMVFGGI